jgi:hypothetical protein
MTYVLSSTNALTIANHSDLEGIASEVTTHGGTVLSKLPQTLVVLMSEAQYIRFCHVTTYNTLCLKVSTP